MRDAAASPASTPKDTVATTQPPEEVPQQLTAEKMMQDNLLILGMLFFIFYFILIRPQQKRVRAHQDLMKEIKKGDKITTGGGIIGTIQKFEGDDIAVVEIAPSVKVRVTRQSITEIISDKLPSGESANDN